MAHLEIPVATNPDQFRTQLAAIHESDGVHAVLSNLGGGMLRFAGLAFPEADPNDIYAQEFKREPSGRGAHFDIYNPLLNKDYPWLGVYNIAGTARMQTMVLPADLARTYDTAYPKPTGAALQARRHLAQFAITAPDASVFSGTLEPGMGFVLAQRPDGPHIVHDIVPVHQTSAGSFVKMIVPNTGRGRKKAVNMLTSEGYLPFDELVTKVFDGHSADRTVIPLPGALPQGGLLDQEARLPSVLDGADRSPRSSQPQRRPRRSRGGSGLSGLYD
jgi:hypothetical protein